MLLIYLNDELNDQKRENDDQDRDLMQEDVDQRYALQEQSSTKETWENQDQ